MTTRIKDHGWLPAMFGALLCALVLGVSLPTAGAAQAAPGFRLAVDPLTSCAAGTPVTGTVALTGLTTGYGFDVQLRGDGEILDGQAFEGYDSFPDGDYAWSVAGPSGAAHDVLDLSFALYDGEGDPIRTETVVLNPDCDLNPPAILVSPSASPVAVIPAMESISPMNGADDGRNPDAVLVAGFAGGTVLVLTALAFLDRRPEP